MSVAERFWAKVRKTQTCWIWTAARNSSGYGWFYFGNEKSMWGIETAGCATAIERRIAGRK